MEETGGRGLFPEGTYYFKIKPGIEKIKLTKGGSRYVVKFHAMEINSDGDTYDKNYTENFFTWTINPLVEIALNIKQDPKTGKLKWELEQLSEKEFIATIKHEEDRNVKDRYWARMSNFKSVESNTAEQPPVEQAETAEKEEEIPF